MLRCIKIDDDPVRAVAPGLYNPAVAGNTGRGVNPPLRRWFVGQRCDPAL